jgi:hypothetical protein
MRVERGYITGPWMQFSEQLIDDFQANGGTNIHYSTTPTRRDFADYFVTIVALPLMYGNELRLSRALYLRDCAQVDRSSAECIKNAKLLLGEKDVLVTSGTAYRISVTVTC